MLSSGSAAMRANFKTLGQGIASQVQQVMADPHRLVARTRLVGGPLSPACMLTIVIIILT